MQNVVEQIIKEKAIVIVRGAAKETLVPFTEAIYRGGIRFLECTYDATETIPDEEIAENIRMLAEHFQGRMVIGAGTVIREKQVELTKAAGGKFIISPDTNPTIIAKTKAEGLVSIPGAFTPTEAAEAWRAGADFVKLFPVQFMGPSYLKALKAPLSHIRFLAVGGVNRTNIPEYLASGASGFGIAGEIVDKKRMAENDYETIEKIARSYVETIQGV